MNGYMSIVGSLNGALAFEKLKGKRLSCYGNVMRKDKNRMTKILTKPVDWEYKSKVSPKKRWINCMKDDIRSCSGKKRHIPLTPNTKEEVKEKTEREYSEY